MRRRDMITLLGGGLAWPLGALAQGSAIPVIGFLNSESPKPFAQLVAAFRQGLNEQGYLDGRNVKIEERWAEGDENRLAAIRQRPRCAEALGIWHNWAKDITGRPVEGGHFFPEHNPRETITELRALFNA